ncbi:MAG TPA: CotH kinase family protein [Bacteroidales bacterium]|nr:CotH kinase family protein [Bacteroidales bacterium]
MKKLSFIIILFSFVSWHLAQSQDIDHWETAVFNTDTWRYFVGTSELDAAWRSLSFDDEGWAQGTGGFGYSDDDDNTVIPQCTSVFLRIIFNVPDTALIAKALLSMDYDDAFVAYLNDVEIARAGITGTYPTFDQTGTDHEATMYLGGEPESFIIYKNKLMTCLLPGENVLAVQVHNTSPTSSDLSSNAFLSFGILNSTTDFRPVPYWFTPPFDFTSSNLPIVIINTDGGVTIPDDPRILANMKIIYRGEGLRNYLTDMDSTEYLNYNGRINIEIRGSSSQADPKKQYGLSTKQADGIINNNVKLLGLPADNDWILNGLVFETSLIRNYLCYNLSRMIGEYASRTVYCEVVINGEYKGLYLLLEKIKQGHDRVNVINIEPDDNTFPNITGGYITKADKTTGDDPIAWTMSSYIGLDDVGFIHELPEPENVTSGQNVYIRSEFEKLSTAASDGNISLVDGFPSVIDVPSFIDYMIINELSANCDAYQFSTFYHKDRNGKLRAGPIWDLDLTFGYDLFFWGFDRSKTDTWQFWNGDNEGPAFWRDLFINPKFKCYLSKRWNQLIQPGQPLNLSVIEQFIDQTDSIISEAVQRDSAIWISQNYHEYEINKIKTFIYDRIIWITNNIGSYSACSDIETPPLAITKIMYFPDSTFNFPDSKEQEFIEIVNTGNETVNLAGVYFSGTGFVYQFPSSASIAPDGKKILASNRTVFTAKYGIAASGQYTRNLSNSGESLILADGFGNVIDSVKYSNLPPWPDANANEYYLDLSDPLSDNSLAANWVASNATIVSVEDFNNEMSLKLYPSIVRDILQIEGEGVINTLQLYDIQGYMLKVITVNSVRYNLDMTSQLPGMYLIKVTSGERNYVRKIIKE